MIRIPREVLRAHVWPRVHELELRATLEAIQTYGCSNVEDLPALLACNDVVRWCDSDDDHRPERAGWSLRVTEARAALAQLHGGGGATIAAAGPGTFSGRTGMSSAPCRDVGLAADHAQRAGAARHVR